jgi:hypothetical protein
MLIFFGLQALRQSNCVDLCVPVRSYFELLGRVWAEISRLLYACIHGVFIPSVDVFVLDCRHRTAHNEIMKTFNPDIGVSTRWRKGGPSPNPGGRPKSRTISEALRQKLAAIKEDDPQHRTFAEVLAENLVSLACAKERNSVAAAVEIANRVEGRVHERIEFADLTHQLTTKSDAELEHFLEFGCWPEDVNISHPPSEKTKAN